MVEYGLWSLKYINGIQTNCWCWSGIVSGFSKYSKYNRFVTNDINIAFRYMELSSTALPNEIFEIREYGA